MDSTCPRPNRRTVLRGTFALGAMALFAKGAFAEQLDRTPPAEEGPFYPYGKLPLDRDNDLIIVSNSTTPAVGEVAHVGGRRSRRSARFGRSRIEVAPRVCCCAEATMPADFPGAFDALRAILKRHADGMIVQADTPTEFTVVTRARAPNGKPMWFACVALKKSAVTYHLMPLYFNPKLQAAVPPELRPRKQGKTCFNFQRPDPALFGMLDELTRRGREGFERHGMLEPGPVAPGRLNEALRSGGEDPVALARLRATKGKLAAAKRAATVRNKVRTKRPAKRRR